MKTERLVLLVTPDEKARISREAAKLGVNASEYVRKLLSLLDAEDVRAGEELALLGPELNAMADRLETTFADFRADEARREERWAYVRSDAYRQKIRDEVINDPGIDWHAIGRLFGGSDRRDDGVAAA